LRPDRASEAVGSGRISSPCAARLASLLHAFFASAIRLEEQLEIFLAVIVGDLLARPDRLERAQDHLALHDIGFGIRSAGMVGVPCYIVPARSVARPAWIDLVQVTGAACFAALGFRVADALAGIFDDEGALLDRRGGEQAEPGARASHAVRLAWHVSRLRC